MSDSYRTVRAVSEHTLKVQGSRFIAFAACAESREAAMAVVHQRRAAYHDATHHAFAYRVTPEGHEFRYVDDGEPAGTAGRPILAAIDHGALTNVVVVVTRYFGGTKLGVGGLARAYGDAAAGVLGAAGVEERKIVAVLEISFPHSLVGPVMHVVSTAGAKVIRSAYDEEVHLAIEVRRSGAEAFFDRLRESTRGGVRRSQGG